MDPLKKIELMKSSFTKKELAVYDIVMNNLEDVLRSTATILTEKYNISQATITRFCQKIDYKGFNEFKFDVYKHQKLDNESNNPNSVLDYYSEVIHLIPNTVSNDAFMDLAKIIVESNFVAINGFFRSSLPAQLLHMNLSKISILSSFFPYDHSFTVPQMVNSKSVIIFFSVAGSSYIRTINEINEIEKEKRPKTVLITMLNKHPLRNKMDYVFWLPNSKNQNYPQYLDNQIIFMIFIDLLTNYIIQLKKDEENI